MTMDGVFSSFVVPTAASQPQGIVAGPDGNLWFTEQTGNRIGRITPSGEINEFAIPTSDGGPLFITAGPDGALWFTEVIRSKVGRICTTATPIVSNHTLAVTRTGTSTGTVTSSPAGINCGATCSATLSGTVTLTATPGATAVFGGWTGDCMGGPVTTVTMDADKSCTAAFNTKPDLIETGVGAPPFAGVGTTITITETATNQGGGPAYPGTSTTKLWLSTNNVLDAIDTLLGSRAVPSLIPGATSMGSTMVVIALTTTPGPYFILASADADGFVPESNEANNVASKAISVTGPDLTVQSLSGPSAAGAGQTISVTDTTKAAGGAGAAPASTTSYYISADGVLDGTDTLIGGRAVPPLAAGASSAGTTPATLPSSLPSGSYSIIAKADGPGLIAETVEGNNTKTVAIAVGPDLTIAQVQGVPGNASRGATLNVKPTTKNVGGETAVATTTRIYLRPPSGPDVPLGSRSVPILAPNGTDTGTVAIVIPLSTPPGPGYAIVAISDDGNVVTEAVENNNAMSKSLKIN